MGEKEKLFVIAEIEECAATPVGYMYHIKGEPGEAMFELHDDSPALVRRRQLRYGVPQAGEKFFEPYEGIKVAGWNRVSGDFLIIDPPAPVQAKTELERWADEVEHVLESSPIFGIYTSGQIRELLQRRPK